MVWWRIWALNYFYTHYDELNVDKNAHSNVLYKIALLLPPSNIQHMYI